MASQWFVVKTFYRTTAEGAPQKPDRYYDPDLTMLEERLLLFKAKNREEAVKKAEKNAVEYAKSVQFTNPYGQKVHMEYLNLVDAFEVGKVLADKSEVFLVNRLISRRVPIKKIERLYLEKRSRNPVRSMGRKFLNNQYLTE